MSLVIEHIPQNPVSTPVEHASPRPIDLVHLRRYTLGDRALEREILDLFLKQTPKTIAELRQAATEKAWHAAAHSLKGSGRAVGAWRVARMGELAERAGLPECPETRHDLIAKIEAAAAEAAGYVLALD